MNKSTLSKNGVRFVAVLITSATLAACSDPEQLLVGFSGITPEYRWISEDGESLVRRNDAVRHVE